MKKHADPGIDEVRAARMEISARYGHNIDRMLADHMKQQERYADRLVRLAPRASHLPAGNSPLQLEANRSMLRYGINDIRLFYENDARFLKQF